LRSTRLQLTAIQLSVVCTSPPAYLHHCRARTRLTFALLAYLTSPIPSARHNTDLGRVHLASWRVDLTLTDSRAIGGAVSYLGLFP